MEGDEVMAIWTCFAFKGYHPKEHHVTYKYLGDIYPLPAREYMTICEESPLAFDSVINNLLRQGWELYGYPYTAVDVGKHFFCQAMVRYKKEEIK